MLIVTRPNVTEAAIEEILARIHAAGLAAHVSRGELRVVIGCIGDEADLADVPLAALPGVESVIPVLRPYKLASREGHLSERTALVTIGTHTTPRPCVVGGPTLAIIAGPCSVEGVDMLHATARAVQSAGAHAVRGGAFKPRTSPYAFQGLGSAALEMLTAVRAEVGLPVVTEVMDPRQVEAVASAADCLQIGARNMQNFPLLAEVGQTTEVPVLLKRGLSATVHELLMAAEYVLARGNGRVILCERGIRTFETATRNTLDVAVIPILKRETYLPVIVDPSHAGGSARLVAPLARAAVAAGADGLLVEVHPSPATARSDGEQSLDFGQFRALMEELTPVAAAVGRILERPRGDPRTDYGVQSHGPMALAAAR
jgi:3-deoxy-7-phosphoheptulonate synthase